MTLASLAIRLARTRSMCMPSQDREAATGHSCCCESPCTQCPAASHRLAPPFAPSNAPVRRSPTRSRNCCFSRNPPPRRFASSSDCIEGSADVCDFQSICDCPSAPDGRGIPIRVRAGSRKEARKSLDRAHLLQRRHLLALVERGGHGLEGLTGFAPDGAFLGRKGCGGCVRGRGNGRLDRWCRRWRRCWCRRLLR